MLLEHIFGVRRGTTGRPIKGIDGFMVSTYSRPSPPSPVASFVTARTSFTTRSARHSLLMNIEPEYDPEDTQCTRNAGKRRRASQRASSPAREEERGALEQKETHEVGGFGQSETSPVGSASSTIRNDEEMAITDMKQDKGKGKENEVKKEPEGTTGAAAGGNAAAVQIEASEDETIHQQQEDELTVIAVDVPLPPSPPSLPESGPSDVSALELPAPAELERSKSQPPAAGPESGNLRKIPSAPKLNNPETPSPESQEKLRQAIALLESIALKELAKAEGSGTQENKDNVPPTLEGSPSPIPPHLSHVHSSAASTKSSIHPIAEVPEPEDMERGESSGRLKDYHRAVADRILHPKSEDAESEKRIVMKDGEVGKGGKNAALDDSVAPHEIPGDDSAIADDASARIAIPNGLLTQAARSISSSGKDVSQAEAKDEPAPEISKPRRRDSIRQSFSGGFGGLLKSKNKMRRGSEAPPVTSLSRANSIRQATAESTHELTPPPTPPTASIAEERPKSSRLSTRSKSIFKGFGDSISLRKDSNDKSADKDAKTLTSAEPSEKNDSENSAEEKKEKKPLIRKRPSMASIRSFRDVMTPLAPVVTKDGNDGAPKSPKDEDKHDDSKARTSRDIGKRRPSWWQGGDGEKRKFGFKHDKDKDKAESTHTTNDAASAVIKDSASDVTKADHGPSTPGVDSEVNSLAGSAAGSVAGSKAGSGSPRPLLRTRTESMRTKLKVVSMFNSKRDKEKEKKEK